MNILIIDPDITIRTKICNALLANGYNVSVCETGAEGIVLANQACYDIAISNVILPETDGFCLCRQWKLAPGLRKIPFLLYTDLFADDSDRVAAEEAGADGFVAEPPSKPGSLADLVVERIKNFSLRSVECSSGQPVSPLQHAG
ncbi:MAG: response regulator, partial [Verrucomicrobiae bacterium]|nr:response regulator [Verrucomicrobiae bacterium]